MDRVNVIGAGSWGVALATIITRNSDNQTLIWSRDNDVIKDINFHHRSKKHFPKVILPRNIKATDNLQEVVNCDAILLAVPAQVVREICLKMLQAKINNKIPIVICSKGIEEGSLLLVSEIVSDILPKSKNVAILSGPNFAHEIMASQPAATTLACRNKALGSRLLDIFGSAEFRTYLNKDIIGTQICGALKNVLAIACGIAKGRGFGENAMAALVTRGIAEISRLIEAKGGDVKTIMGLAGIGDVMLTCFSLKSRNTLLGFELAKGKNLSDLLAKNNTIVEGVYTTQSVYNLAKQLNIDLPICDAVYKILYRNEDIDESIHHLLARPLTSDV